MPEPLYATTAEVAGRYRVPDGTVRYWRHVGYGPRSIKVGRRVLYPIDELDAFDRELRERAA